MPTIAWIAVAVFACIAVAFALLWLRARRGGASAGGLPMDGENTLHAVNEVTIGGTKFFYGVAQPDTSVAEPFLVDLDMTHLQAGDRFTMRNGQPYKIETRAPAAAAPAASDTPGPASGVQQDVDAQNAVAPAVGGQPAVGHPAAGQMAKPEAAPLTVLYTGEQQPGLPDLEQAFPFLDVIEGADKGMRFPLPYAEAGIGRSDDNVVTLSDNGASRQHCVIEYRGGDFVLCDLQSTNGTHLNGEAVQQRVLEFGDRVDVSDSAMIFSCEGFELRDSDPNAAIYAFEQCLDQEPDFLHALKNLAFLLERDVRRKKEAEPLWKRIGQLEKGR